MKNLILFISAVATLSMTSCSSTYYKPTALNVPMLQEKGEGHAVLSTNLNGTDVYDLNESQSISTLDQAELSTSYAVTEKVGVQLNGSYVYPKSKIYMEGFNLNMAELGVGNFGKISPRFSYEAYGLFAYGSMHKYMQGYANDLGSLGRINGQTFEDFEGSFHIRSAFYRYGLQGSIAFRSSKFFASFATRLVNTNFHGVTGDLAIDDVDQIKELTRIGKNNIYLEPAITLGFDFSKLRIQYQWGASLQVHGDVYNFDPRINSIGIGYNLKPKK